MAGVVWVAGQYGQGTVDLLSQYNAGKLVGQSHAAEGKEKISALAGHGGLPVGRANGEHKALGALVADAPDLRSELL